jgi:hypothetical protein
MRRYLFIAGIVLATLLLAALGASISLVRSIRSRYTTRLGSAVAPSWAGR